MRKAVGNIWKICFTPKHIKSYSATQEFFPNDVPENVEETDILL